MLPSPDQYTVAVRFCPIFYKLQPHDQPPVIDLPYSMVFAVATKSSVYLYDTQQSQPIGLISNIHYTRLTDLAWSHDGRILIVSSTDGFCTLITFAYGELGVEYVSDDEAKENDTVQKEIVANDEMKTSTSSHSIHDSPANDNPTAAVTMNPIQNGQEPRSAAEVVTPVVASETTTSATVNVIVVNSPENVIALEIPTGIISTKNKFDSPEITSSKPATPISFRRAPRPADSPITTGLKAPATSSSPGHFNVVRNTSTTSIEQPAQSPAVTTDSAVAKTTKQSSKKATPIAVRRHQRNILADGGATLPTVASTTEDEAMDAWPIDQPRPLTATAVVVDAKSTNGTTLADANAVVHVMDVDETEDIRLVYDDDSQTDGTVVAEVTQTPNTIDTTPNTKTPRRVELRTISTPKAKKKLM